MPAAHVAPSVTRGFAFTTTLSRGPSQVACLGGTSRRFGTLCGSGAGGVHSAWTSQSAPAKQGLIEQFVNPVSKEPEEEAATLEAIQSFKFNADYEIRQG